MTWFNRKKEKEPEPQPQIDVDVELDKMFKRQERVSKLFQEQNPQHNPAEQFARQLDTLSKIQEITENFNEAQRQKIIQQMEIGADNEPDVLDKILPSLLEGVLSAKTPLQEPNTPFEQAGIPTEQQFNLPLPAPEPEPERTPITFQPLSATEKKIIDKNVVPRIPRVARNLFKDLNPDKKAAILHRIAEKLEQ